LQLEPFEVLNGIFSIISVIISVIVGLKIASKYFEFKKREFLLVGITGILMSEPWWPSSISFISAITGGPGLTLQEYLFIGNLLVPFSVFIWLIAFTDLLYKDQQKKVLLIWGIAAIIYQIFFFIFLFVEPSVLADLGGFCMCVDIEYKSFARYFLFAIAAITLITGALFAKESLKSDNPEMKLRGKFLMFAFISWFFGAVMDALLPMSELTVFVFRSILITSSFCFYIGFIMPDIVKKWFLKTD
jgi:hypothetical protein